MARSKYTRKQTKKRVLLGVISLFLVLGALGAWRTISPALASITVVPAKSKPCDVKKTTPAAQQVIVIEADGHPHKDTPPANPASAEKCDKG